MRGKNRKRIKEAIREYAGAGRFEVFTGKVSAVDEGATTCEVDIEEELTIFDVRLRAVITDDTGVWVLPKVGSFVQIAQIEGGTDFVLLRASEVDKVFVKIGDKTLEITTDGFVFNGGNNDGLVKVNELVDQLNKIEDKVNDLISKFNNHTHAITAVPTTCPAGAGTATGTTSTTGTPEPTTLTNTTKTDIENPDITQ